VILTLPVDVKNYLPYFPQPEVRMMLTGFAAREVLHIAGLFTSHRNIGLPESTYNEFLEYAENEGETRLCYRHQFEMADSSVNLQRILPCSVLLRSVWSFLVLLLCCLIFLVM
jgi:hypothetical protein